MYQLSRSIYRDLVPRIDTCGGSSERTLAARRRVLEAWECASGLLQLSPCPCDNCAQGLSKRGASSRLRASEGASVDRNRSPPPAPESDSDHFLTS